MAEEDKSKDSSNNENKETPPQFSEEKLAELVKNNVNASLKDVMANLNQNQNNVQQQQNVEKEKEPDFWDTFIDGKVNPRVAKAELQSEAAVDKLDYYSSDDWLVELDDFLVEDDPDKRKEEKTKIREDIEKYFNNLLKAGRGLPRKDIAAAVLGEKVKKDKIKYQESVVNKSQKKRDSDLQKARGAVSISSGNISNYSPQDIHGMSSEKIIETFGSLTF